MVVKVIVVGVQIIMLVVDMFWGDCYGILKDFFGYQWLVVIYVCDVVLEEFVVVMGKVSLEV